MTATKRLSCWSGLVSRACRVLREAPFDVTVLDVDDGSAALAVIRPLVGPADLGAVMAIEAELVDARATGRPTVLTDDELDSIAEAWGSPEARSAREQAGAVLKVLGLEGEPIDRSKCLDAIVQAVEEDRASRAAKPRMEAARS